MSSVVPDKGISYKSTLNLPTTSLPLQANPAQQDPALLERWRTLYAQAASLNQGATPFILHDGPPYTNGPIHLGHAYNKILKDIISKAYRMMGYYTPVKPGWDCHGLPIEQKVRQELPCDASPTQIRTACREYAYGWMEVQREQFKKLGVIMDWENPYLTMDYAYEARIIEAFKIFYQKGYIDKKLKTVPWCSTDHTVLAAAEIEYKEKKDPSAYILFALDHTTLPASIPSDKPLYALIWTTTPWTIPLNRAILYNPSIEYALIAWHKMHILIGAQLVDQLAQLLGVADLAIVTTLQGSLLDGAYALHPITNTRSVFIADGLVASKEGTALVHCAPGCGPHDYEIGLRHNLEIFSPISAQGTYTNQVGIQELVGMPTQEGQFWVLKTLDASGKLLVKKTIKHSYPHCWRCRNPLIFRATSQWFINLSHDDLRTKALEALSTINFYPTLSKNFLKATLEGRLEWCISRQRVWGVPITSLHCTMCNKSSLSQSLLNKVIEGVKKEGIDYWQHVPLEQLVSLVEPCCDQACLIKEYDILDVWFDSGVSHFAVLYNNQALSFPANLYAEGVDQHRGWFQSSLLTALVLEERAPMQAILTHGYTVDDKGYKMSKSLGNVVAPDDIIKQIGTDGLRLWVASIACGADAVVTKTLLDNVHTVYRKIRNTCRFLLANLYDFDPVVDACNLFLIDAYALERHALFSNNIIQAYKNFDITSTYHQLGDYTTTDLSALYLDIIKDRLYTAGASSKERRSAQTACFIILESLTRLMAPIMSFTAEHIFDQYKKTTGSIHLEQFIVGQSNTDPLFERKQKLLLALRQKGLKSIEMLREQNIIKHSLEASLHIDYTPYDQEAWDSFKHDLDQRHESIALFFKEFFIVSACTFKESKSSTDIIVSKAQGLKCPRCWQWTITQASDGLCERCAMIIQE